MTIRWEPEAERALRAVYEGGLICGEREADRQVVATKESARDLVTEADLRIEHHIRALLEPCGHPILGEETDAGRPPFPPAPGQPVWLVDPIDGTTNFAAGMAWYGVSVGLWVDGAFVTGAVSLPAARELFFTHGDRGAFLNGKPLRVEGKPLRVEGKPLRAGAARFADSLVAAAFSGAAGDPERRRRQYELFGRINDSSRGCLRLGSTAANICQVAAGRLQAAYGIAARLWDVAGALAVARQAGAALCWRLDAADPTRLDYIVGSADAVRAINALFAETGAAAPLPEEKGPEETRP